MKNINVNGIFPEYIENVHVVRVSDGDSFVVSYPWDGRAKLHVRLSGVNTPDYQRMADGDIKYVASRVCRGDRMNWLVPKTVYNNVNEYTVSRIFRQNVTLRSDPTSTDQVWVPPGGDYPILIAVAYLSSSGSKSEEKDAEDGDIGLDLLQKGLACVYFLHSNKFTDARKLKYLAAEQSARENEYGIWSVPLTPTWMQSYSEEDEILSSESKEISRPVLDGLGGVAKINAGPSTLISCGSSDAVTGEFYNGLVFRLLEKI